MIGLAVAVVSFVALMVLLPALCRQCFYLPEDDRADDLDQLAALDERNNQ